jgi:hypothetical protein
MPKPPIYSNASSLPFSYEIDENYPLQRSDPTREGHCGVACRALMTSTSWLNNPIAMTFSVPLLTVAGAATTIATPLLLSPERFAGFALLLSIFQYVSDFDLGLSRLSDRTLTRVGSDVARAIQQLLIARFVIAAMIMVVVSLAAIFTGALTAVVGLAGVAFMLSCGPLSFYRAKSNIRGLTMATIIMQFGMSLPRFGGLLVGGVSGYMLALAIWSVMTAVVLNLPFVDFLRLPRQPPRLIPLLAESLPLFAFSSIWFLYLLASRWFSWLVSSTTTEAGLFAFGANLVAVGIAMIGMVGQAYYPRHLIQMDKNALFSELVHVALVVTGGSLIGIVVCRFGLRLVFPHFAEAAAPTATLLIVGIPLCLCAWLIPLAIARSAHPLREAFGIFAIGLSILYGLMWLLNRVAGIEGQAWASGPPAMFILAMQLHLVVGNNMLDGKKAVIVWLSVAMLTMIGGGLWYSMFDAS